MTAFWISAYAGNLEVFHTQKAIKELYTEGADINILSNYGESALYIACKNNKLDCVKYLCHIGLDINALSSRSGISAVGIASYGGFLGIVKFLNYKKASLILCEKNTWKTPLFLACKSRQYEIAEYLINFSEVTSYSTPFDFSPLIVCILNRNEKLLSLLLKNQVGIYLKNQKNDTILAKAVEIGNANIVKLIYTHHRELNSENNDGFTPFMASLLMHKYDIAQAMFELDVNVYYKNKRGKTIIDIAKEHNDKNLLKKLFILGFTENIELNDNPDTCCLDICEREIDSHMNKSRENNNRLPSLRSYLSTDKERIRECINYKVNHRSYRTQMGVLKKPTQPTI
jgi:ankyrin repeat protein